MADRVALDVVHGLDAAFKLDRLGGLALSADMTQIQNPYRGQTDGFPGLADIPAPSTNLSRVDALIARCPRAGATPLVAHADLAKAVGAAALFIKDERARMDMGSFKALGAAYVIASDAQDGPVRGATYVTASAGNHGLSVAAGATAFGAASVVYIAQTVPEAFAQRLAAEGARVVREGATYEDSMAAAKQAAQDNGWQLLSDSSWPGYTDPPHRLMEGYLMLMGEAIAQIPAPPTHVFLQAGVGGLAGACAALARVAWGNAVTIVTVEPEAAPALFGSIQAGFVVAAEGPVSAMGRLDCKEPSLIALKGLAHDADVFQLISEDQGHAAADMVAKAGLPSTASGAAGLAGAVAFDLPADARVLVILSEGPE